MAATYNTVRQHIRFATSKAMFTLFNGAGSGVVAKMYRIWVRNIQQTAMTGVPLIFRLDTISAASGGVPAQFNRMTTAAATVPAQVLAGEGMTVTRVATIRRFPWSSDEPAVITGTIDEVQLQRPFVNMFDFNNNDAAIQPFTLREGEGLSLIVPTTIAITAYCTISCEFTLE